MEMIAIYPVLAVLLLFGIKLPKRGAFHEDYMSLKTAKCLQGFAIVVIMIHHLTQKLTNYGNIASKINFFNEIGSYCVALFFLCSGYGIVKSMQTKDNYVKSFLFKRLVTVLVPFYLINLIYIIVKLIDVKRLPVSLILKYFFGLTLVNSDSWYIVASVYLYLLVFLCFRFIKKEWISYTLVFVGIMGYIAVGLYSGHGTGYRLIQGEWWFNSILIFFVGMLWARFESKIVPAVRKGYWIYLPVGIILTFVTYKLNMWCLGAISYYKEWEGYGGFAEKWECLGIQTLAFTVAMITLMILLMKVKFGNIVLSFIGGITVEIYLIHRLFINELSKPIHSNILYFAAVVACGIAVGFLLHLVFGFVKKLILREKKPSAKVLPTEAAGE